MGKIRTYCFFTILCAEARADRTVADSQRRISDLSFGLLTGAMSELDDDSESNLGDSAEDEETYDSRPGSIRWRGGTI